MSESIERFRLYATAILLLVKDDKILLCRRHNTGWEDGNYGLMAGHIDGGESFSQALCREAKEELGITINPVDVRFFHATHHVSNKEYIYMFFAAEKWQGEPKVCEPDKCDDVRWFPMDALPSNVTPNIPFLVDCYRKGVAYSEDGFEQHERKEVHEV